MALPTLDALNEERFRSAGTVSRLEVVCPENRTSTSRRKRRQTEARTKHFCKANGLSVHEIPPVQDKERHAQAWDRICEIASSHFDLGVVVSFGYFLPATLIKALPKGAINVHPSLLPKYRGAAPIEHALLNNDEVTGVSIIEVSPTRFDAGAILRQTEYHIDSSPETVASKLVDDLSAEGARSLMHVLGSLDEHRRHGVEQSSSDATGAPKLKPETGYIRWSEQRAVDIFGRWRAMVSRTGVYTRFQDTGKRVRLRQMRLPHHFDAVDELHDRLRRYDEDVVPGVAVFDKPSRAVWVRCHNQWIACMEFQVEGRKVCSAEEFANGFRFKRRGETLCFQDAAL